MIDNRIKALLYSVFCIQILSFFYYILKRSEKSPADALDWTIAFVTQDVCLNLKVPNKKIIFSLQGTFSEKATKITPKLTSKSLKSFISQIISVKSHQFWIFSVQKNVSCQYKGKISLRNSFQIQIFICEFGEWFLSLSQKKLPVTKKLHSYFSKLEARESYLSYFSFCFPWFIAKTFTKKVFVSWSGFFCTW